MSFGFLNLLMLAGLAGLLIPPLIHLLNRRRFDVVDWGAMQFLQLSQRTRRRVFIEELLLMLLRMGLIALLVLALAAPFAVSPLFDRLGLRDNRDVVIIVDGSTSMGYAGTGKTPHEKAREWAADFIDGLAPGDGVAILQAKQQVIPVQGELTADRDKARAALAELAPPRGGCDWPQAVQAAYQLLQTSRRPLREVIVLSDGQKYTWADDRTLERWRLLAPQLDDGSKHRPRLWVVQLDKDRPAPALNWSLAPIRSGRALASAAVDFRSSLKPHGQDYEKPYRLRLEIDGQPAPDLTPPKADDIKNGQVPFPFSHSFTSPGSHLVSVIVEPDPPPGKRPDGYQVKDQLPGDNRQDFAVMMPVLPVLLVNGAADDGRRRRGAEFLKTALAPTRDRKSLLRARVVRPESLTEALARDIGPEANTRPRVLVLANVMQLTAEQIEAVGRFVAEGGGLLVTLGNRVDRHHYNDALFRRGDGWLPTTLEDAVGNEYEPPPADEGKPDPAAHPLPSSFTHPALGLFRGESRVGLGSARFPRWWKLTPPAQGAAATTAARLDSLDPFLVEKPYGKGRVILCAVPLDDSWGTNLHREVLEFPLLAHELVYYLAGARVVEHNLLPGQPLVYQPQGDEEFSTAVLQPPHGEARRIDVKEWPLVWEDTREPGVYMLTTPGGRTVYYVVQPDPRETEDLSLCSDEDRGKVAELIPLSYVDDADAILGGPGKRQELWWVFLLVVVGFLCAEVWMTRRIVKGR